MPDPKKPKSSSSSRARSQPHGDGEPTAATTASEQTPLLGAGSRPPAPISVSHSRSHQHQHQHHRGSYGGGDAEGGFDPGSEADLNLARSFSSIPSGLAPEALESAMLRNRRQSGGSSGSGSGTRRRPSYAAPHEHGERSDVDSVIVEEEEGGSGSSDSGGEEEEASSLSSTDIDRIDIEAGPPVAVANGGGNGDAKMSHHHHHPQQQREFMIDTDNRRFWAIFISVLATYFLACFDGTIMASSHPVITSYFRSSNSASWLSTAFLLTNTAFQPMVGRLSDSLGRRNPYLVTMAIFAFATLWCALAQSMTSFIVARAVCGLGAGGMMALGSIITSDLVPIERRGAYQSYVNIVYGVGSASGAALGGLMADKLGWRWEFGIQVLPMVPMLLVTLWVLPPDLGLVGKRESLVDAMKLFDFGGSLLLTASTTFLILGLNLGGNVLPWSHPFIIASLVISAVCFPACLWVESWVKLPIMPLELLHSSPRGNIIISNFLASFLMNAILFNAPLFFQAVLLRTATESGLYLVIPTASASVCGTLTGFLITRTRRLKWPLGLGSGLFLAGTALLASVRRGWPAPAYLLCLIPASMGQGFQFPGAFLAVLAASAQREQAVVTSTLVLWRALGGVVGIAASSLVLQNALLRYLNLYVTIGGGGSGSGRDEAWKAALVARVRGSVEAVARIADGGVREQVVRSYEAAVHVTFVCCVAVAVASVLLIVPIRLPRLGERRKVGEVVE